MDPLNTISVCTNNWCSQCSLSHIFQNSSCVFPCSCFMFIPLALSLSPETLSIFMEAVISTAAAPSLASPQFHWSFPPPTQSSMDLATNCSHFGGSLHGNAAQPRGCSCAFPVANGMGAKIHLSPTANLHLLSFLGLPHFSDIL